MIEAAVIKLVLFAYGAFWVWITDRQLRRLERAIDDCISRDSVDRRLRVLSDRIDQIAPDNDSDAHAG